MSIADMLRRAAEEDGERIALVCQGRRWSYAALWAAAQGAATLVRESETRYVALLDGNGEAGVIALFGAALAGLPFAPLNYRRADADITALLDRIAPAWLIAGDDRAARLGAAAGATVSSAAAFVAAAQAATPTAIDSDGDDIAVQIFTSGTTGAPKAALLRHTHLLAYVAATAAPAKASAHEGSLVSVPPYHVANVVAVLTAVQARRRLLLLPAFEPTAWLRLAEAEAPTYAFVVPTMLARILDQLDGDDRLASLTAISYGAGPMPPALLERALARFPDVRFTNAYGLTETCATIASLTPDDHRAALASGDPAVRARLRSAGRPLPGIEIEIRDTAGTPLPAGQRGEVYARGIQVSGEYRDRDARDADGWFATRDLGWRDADGYLFLGGRADDVIVRGGENISPGEIEAVLLTHPAVAEACAVGLPSTEWGESIGAALVLRPGHAAPDPAEMRALVKARLRSSHVPERIAVLDSLPYNELGKLLRRDVRASPYSGRLRACKRRGIMTDYSSDLLRLLSSRGYIHQLTDAHGLDALAGKQIVPGYIGFDPTAPSLHVGSLVQIMMLRRLQQAGHKPIVLMGGGTGKIGDPSFKDEARKLLTDETIAANVASIKRVFERFLTFGNGPTDAVMVDNADWLDKLEYIPFLREIGQHFSVNRMLSFDSVKLRLDREQSLSFLEFNYMILQGYDFLELARRAGCRLQMGGSDQWGNIVNGIELTRRVAGEPVYGLTTPLITTADGGKMGKTMSGAVWLNEEQLSAYDYWQFWRNTDDRDVGRFLRLFTDLPLDEIARLEALEGAGINDAKKVLADAATALCRGEAAAAEAAETARRTFEEGAAGDSLPTLAVDGSIGILDALVGLGLVASKGEAKRLIKGGGARVGDDKVSDEALVVTVGTEPVRIAAGKKHHGLLVAAA